MISFPNNDPVDWKAGSAATESSLPSPEVVVMVHTFPCPNPACTQVFRAETVQLTGRYHCPSCGTVFQFRSKTAPGEKARPVQRKGPPPLPAKIQGNPTGEDTAQSPPSEDPGIVVQENEILGPGPLVRAPQRRRAQGGGWFKGMLVFLILAGTTAGVLYLFRAELGELLDPQGEQREAFRRQGNFRFRAGAGWRADERLRESLGANLAVSRKAPRGHMALYYRDLHTQALSPAQMLEVALIRLRGYFPQMDYEDPLRREKEGVSGQLQGEEALVFRFSGLDPDSVPMRGECYLLTRQGYAYWLLFWGPTDHFEVLAEHWEQLRQGFHFYNNREGWKPAPVERASFSDPEAGFGLEYVKEIWKPIRNPQDADPAALLVLHGFEAQVDEATGKRGKVVEYAGYAAEIVVLRLKESADLKGAVEVAQSHLRQKLQDLHPTLKMERIPGSESQTKLGSWSGQIDRLQVSLNPGNDRYVLLAVRNVRGGTLVVQCECRWERKEYWEQEFKEVLATLRGTSSSAESP